MAVAPLIEFVVRARKTPTDPKRFLGDVGQENHVEYLTQILVNGLFVSQGHRDDVCLTFVFEGSADYSRVIQFRGDQLGTISDQTERGILNLFADCLTAGVGLAKEASIEVRPGVTIAARSFESLLKHYSESRPIYLLDKKGLDVRESNLETNAVFVLTDHIPMPPKQLKSMVRRGAQPVSLGPVVLHASQCVVLIQNEYDRIA